MIGGIFTSFLLELIVYPPLYEIWLGRRAWGREFEFASEMANRESTPASVTRAEAVTIGRGTNGGLATGP
jgi:hypothetical protein